MIKEIFKKKTREERVLQRTQSVFMELISDCEFEFTDLENVQIMNNVKLRLTEHLNNKRSEYLTNSMNCNQVAIEIKLAIDFIK